MAEPESLAAGLRALSRLLCQPLITFTVEYRAQLIAAGFDHATAAAMAAELHAAVLRLTVPRTEETS
jgi:hypothetical protein